MKGIVITPMCEISVKDFESPLYKSVGEVVDGYIEHVLPRLLEKPYCMIVNEEGLLRNLPINLVGSLLCDTISNGIPIVGTIVIMKDGINEEGEPDILGLTEDETSYMYRLMKTVFGLTEVQEDSQTTN